MGKKSYKSFNGYGFDIGQHRADDLDKKAVQYLKIKNRAKVLDLGCGAMGQSKKLAQEGIEVVAIDIDDFSTELTAEDKNITFIQTDIRELANTEEVSGVTDVVTQRTLHYLEYTEARKLLRFLHKAVLQKNSTINRTILSGKLFVSVSGIDSDLGNGYVGKNTRIEDRFFPLPPAQADIFGVQSPICLYTESEFRNLLEEAGWQIDELWVSAFKNLKAVCS
jgi:SAM-dependent methyltransferase